MNKGENPTYSAYPQFCRLLSQDHLLRKCASADQIAEKFLKSLLISRWISGVMEISGETHPINVRNTKHGFQH